MKSSGSIKQVNNRFLWTYQDEKGFRFGFADTMEEAQAALEDAGQIREYTMDEFFEIFMSWKEQNLKPLTKSKYQSAYHSFIHPVIGPQNISAVMPEQLELLVTNLVQNPAVSPITANLVKILLGAIFKRACRMKVIERNPMTDIEIPRNKKKPTRRLAFTEEQLAEVLQRVQGSDYELEFNLAAWTGMRMGEVLGLQWEDIDRENSVIRVRKNLEQLIGGWILNTPKTTTSTRTIPISEKHLDILEAHRESEKYKQNLQKSEDTVIKTGNGSGSATGKIGMSGFVFISRAGTPMSGSSVSSKMRNIVNDMKQEGLLEQDATYTFHSLRHTFASRALSKGMNVKVVSELLGHADTSITLDIYTHVFEEDKRREMEKAGMLD